MKKLALLLAIAGLIGCKEVPPIIDFSEPIVLANDTTYTTTDIPTGVKRNALIEDISGVRCNNCPKAAAIAHDIQDTKGKDRVVVMTLHPTNIQNFTAPYPESKDSFNTDEATQIISSFYVGNIQGLPTGGVSRKVFDGETQTFLNYSTWGSFVDQILAEDAKAEVELEIKNQDGRKYAANVKVTFLDDVAEQVNVSAFIIESHIKSKQKLPDNSYDKEYLHNSILRKGITSIQGISLGKDNERGRVYEKGIEVELSEELDLAYTSIVFLLQYADGSNNEVIQCVEAPIPN